jgi:hypothetical protein
MQSENRTSQKKFVFLDNPEGWIRAPDKKLKFN